MPKVNKKQIPYISDFQSLIIGGYNANEFSHWKDEDDILYLDTIVHPSNTKHLTEGYNIAPNTTLELKFVSPEDIETINEYKRSADDMLDFDRLTSSMLINYNLTDNYMLNITVKQDKPRRTEKDVKYFLYNLYQSRRSDIDMSLVNEVNNEFYVLFLNLKTMEVKPLVINGYLCGFDKFLPYVPTNKDIIRLYRAAPSYYARLVPKGELAMEDLRKVVPTLERLGICSTVITVRHHMINNIIVTGETGPVQLRKLLEMNDNLNRPTLYPSPYQQQAIYDYNSLGNVYGGYNKQGPKLTNLSSKLDYRETIKLLSDYSLLASCKAKEIITKLDIDGNVTYKKYTYSNAVDMYIATMYTAYECYNGIGTSKESSLADLKDKMESKFINKLLLGHNLYNEITPSDEEEEEEE